MHRSIQIFHSFFMFVLRDDAKSVVIFLFIKSFAPTTRAHTHTPVVRYISYYSLLLIRLKSIKSISSNTRTTDSVPFTLFYLRSSFALNSHEYGPMERSRSSGNKFSPSPFFVCWLFLISPTTFQNDGVGDDGRYEFFATTLNSMSISFFSHTASQPASQHHHIKKILCSRYLNVFRLFRERVEW